MFSLTIVDTDAFLEMSQSAQLLYFHLAMRADDDGFVSSPKKIMRMVGSNDDDIKLLINKKFIIPFERGICVIKHWWTHNHIQKDRYHETMYIDEKAQLSKKENGVYTLDTGRSQGVSNSDTQVRLGKARQGKARGSAPSSDDDEIHEKRFEFFWKRYPTKKEKKKCLKWWKNRKPDKELTAAITNAVEKYKKTDKWKRGFIPYPYTFLYNERWNDEIDESEFKDRDEERDRDDAGVTNI